jgi:hypothetical protein
MVPANMIVLPELPRNSSGNVARVLLRDFGDRVHASVQKALETMQP